MLSDRSEPKESSSSVVVGYCKGDYVQYQVSFTTYGIKSGSVQVRKGTVLRRIQWKYRDQILESLKTYNLEVFYFYGKNTTRV